MKVLQLSKFYPPVFGGIESFVSDLVEELSSEIKCDVLCANLGRKTVVEDHGRYKVVRCGSLGRVLSTSISPALIGELRRLGGQYDIVHVHLPNPMANLAFYLVRPGCKLVVHWHSDILRQKVMMSFYRALQDWLLRRAELIVATSQRYIESSRHLESFRGKCAVVPLGLNPARLKVCQQKVNRIRTIFADKPIVFALGRLVYYKGLSYLIEAMRSVNAYLLIGGSGPLQRQLSRQIAGLGLADKVAMLGDIDQEDLGAYYQACDVFCLPSIRKTEAFGLVQVEAMYFEKPVVSTDVAGSGVSWVNLDGVTGLVVQPEVPDALAGALAKILDDAALRRKFGRNGGTRFLSEFDIRVIAGKMLRAYELVLDGREDPNVKAT